MRAALPAFVAASGAGAPAELDALLPHPIIRDLLATFAPGQLDNLADAVAEALDEHLFREAAPLARRLEPRAGAAMELIALRQRRIEAAREALERFIGGHSSVPEVQRFTALVEAWSMAISSVEAPENPSHRGFEGIIAELRASCIRLP